MRCATGLLVLSIMIATATVAHADPPRIDAVRIQGAGASAEVAILGEFDVPVYSVRSREEGRVLVLDVAQATLPSDGLRAAGETDLIEHTVASTTARGARLELRLAEAVTHRVRTVPGAIRLLLNSEGAASSADEAQEQTTVSLSGVHIERRNRRDRVILEVSPDVEFRVIPSSDGPARIILRGTGVAESVPLELRGPSGSPVEHVRVREGESRTIIEVDRPEGVETTAIREGRRIIWLFSEDSANAGRPRSRTIAREEAVEYTGFETAEVASFLSDVPTQVRANRGARRYTGRRIDLDFKDADIHNILRLLAEVGGVNVVTADDVDGTVTIRMRNVPWDQALDVILQAKGLGMVRRGNLIRVAPRDSLEKEREAAIALRKQQVELAPLETRLIPISYATAENMMPRAQELLSSRGTVSQDERTNVLIVRDITDNLDDVEELVRTLDTQTPQVLIEARIVEATSQYTRDVGIQWGGHAAMSSATNNPTGLTFPGNVGIAGGNFDQNTPTGGVSPFSPTVSPSNFAVNLPAVTGTGQGGALGLSLGSIGGNVNLSVRLSAAEASGVVRIVSSPRILTLDNHEAHIAQGTLIPFSQVSAQGVNTAFQEAKLELRVRPHVTSDGSVAMRVHITRDEPDFTRTSPRGDPTILKREAETHLLVEDGHTAVIGGIYTRNTGRNVEQIPFFGDIPILGVLFQRRRVRDDRNELLIFLTPRIVNRDEALPQS